MSTGSSTFDTGDIRTHVEYKTHYRQNIEMSKKSGILQRVFKF